MFDTLKRIYVKTKDEEYLKNAVTRGWITAEQKKEIMLGEE